MRTLMIVALMVVGLAGVGSATTLDEVTGLTLDQAVAKFGAPSYERQCQDGTKTLAWKHALQPAPAAPVVHTVSNYNGRAAEPKANLVTKFDSTGHLAWARAIR